MKSVPTSAVWSLLVVVVLLCPRLAAASSCGQPYFSDGPEVLKLGNECYEVQLRTDNGGITCIRDKQAAGTTGDCVCQGSHDGNLWGAVFMVGDEPWTGGTQYSETFDYSPPTAERGLVLSYPAPSNQERPVTVEVEVTASDEPFFDLSMRVVNGSTDELDYVHFPSELDFTTASIQRALIPVLPGMMLEPAAFEDENLQGLFPGGIWYPGSAGMFADFVWLETTGGRIAIYTLFDGHQVRPATVWFHRREEPIDATAYYHQFAVRIGEGEDLLPTVRIRVAPSPTEAIAAYRTDNGLDIFPSIAAKSGSMTARLVRSPVYKADANQLGLGFRDYDALLAQLPRPGLLHPVAFQRGGHDQNYPDFLPPNDAYGTTADLAAMFRDAQARGFLVMPYTNPTWWDPDSPTLMTLGPSNVELFAVLNGPGSTTGVHECYGSDPPRGGYVVSPYAEDVEDRLEQLATEMTRTLPSDLVFEDQVGARSWCFNYCEVCGYCTPVDPPLCGDYNPAAPNPTSYIQGWLDHTRTVVSATAVPLMTEFGWDRLAETAVGFHGSVLMHSLAGTVGTTWRPYPMAPLMLRDKVLFYQHDLQEIDSDGFDQKFRRVFVWNLAFGFNLQYNLKDLGLAAGEDWLDAVAAFQNHVLARYATESMTDFTYLDAAEKVTRTVFQSTSVITNWDDIATYATDDHVVAPTGVMVAGDDGSVTAGFFTEYNGASLSASPSGQLLIEERSPNEVVVRMPLGEDTPLTIKLPDNWTDRCAIRVQPYSASLFPIGGESPSSTSEPFVRFTYRRVINEQEVSFYRVTLIHEPRTPGGRVSPGP